MAVDVERHALLAARDEDGFAVDDARKLRGRLADLGFARHRTVHGGAEFGAVRRDQRRAAVDAVIVAFRIDHDGFVKLPRPVDDGADDARRQHALGIIRQHHRAALRQRGLGMGDDGGLAGRACRLRRFPIRPHQMRRMVLGDEAHLACRVPAGLDDEMRNDRAVELGEGIGQGPRCLVLAGETDEDATCAEARDIARDIAGAPDLDFAALNREHRRRRFRRDARNLAIDEIVEHQIADAEHGLPGDKLEGFLEIEHGCCRASPVTVLSDSGRHDRDSQ